MKSRYVLFLAWIIIFTLLFKFIDLPTAIASEEPEGLVGHWDFDDGSGRDLSSNRNDAMLGGGTIYSLGKGHACIRFMPDAEPMRIPASEDSPLAISRGTICFWLNTVTGRNTLIKYDNRAVEINAYRGDFQVRFSGKDDFKYWDLILDYDWPKYDMREWAFYGHPKASVDDSVWHLFAVTYDDQNRRIIGWRDGELISVVDLSTVETEPLKREGFTEISTGEGLIGFMDDLRIYNKVLTDTEIRKIYDSTKSVYAGRRDTIPTDRKVEAYKYRKEDHTLYSTWLQYNTPSERLGENLLKSIIAEGSNSTVKTATKELTDAVESMFGFEPLVKVTAISGPKVVLGTAKTSSWIRKQAEELGLDRIKEDGFVIKAVEDGSDTVLAVVGKVPAGVIFGTFDLIRRIQLGQNPAKLDVLENPQIPIRMVDHWSYFRGCFGDKWRSGGRNDSIYSWEELRTGDTKLIRDWVRMMASVGWNAICPSEVNWHYCNNFLDHLDEVEILGNILRDYGMKLYWSPSYILSLNQQTAEKIYARVPDFGGYLMKLGSEKQNGDPRPPMTNRIADTLKPYGGYVLVRGFCYGNYRYTPEPYRDLIPHDLFAPEDGKFRDNVILVPKGSAGDWDYSAPIPAIDGAMKKTLSGTELVIDKNFPSSWVEKWKWWLGQDTYRDGPESLNKSIIHCLMGVVMISPSEAWTDSLLNQVNYYGLGRLAWNPDRSLNEVYKEWIVQTFGHDPQVLDTINRILLMSDDVARKLYIYRGYRGIWIDKGDENMVENKTPYVINRQGIGPASTVLQKRLIEQYALGLREVYGDPLRGEEFLSSFHFKEHDYRLSIGRTLIEDVYGGMEEAVVLSKQMLKLWKTLEGKIDKCRFEYTLDNLVEFVEDSKSNRGSMAKAFEDHTSTKRDDVLSRLTAPVMASVGTFNVRHYGAAGDGSANDAPAINNAIDACNAAGGGTVFVPSGIYNCGSIHLKSNVTLVLDKGAVVKAMPGIMDPWELNPNDKGLMDPAYYHWEASLIWGKNLKNVKIYGPGTLDGSALTRSSKVPKGTGDKGIALKLCKNIEIRNLNIREGGHYAILATGCENMIIDNVTIKTSRDGLNMSQCRNVEVTHCHIDAVRYQDGYPAGGDDAIKLGSDLSLGKARPSENIIVRNCFLASGCNTLQFGTETIGSFKNIRFENIRIIRAGKAGISIGSNDGSVIEGVHYKDITMKKTFVPIFIKISDVARVPEGTYKRGTIRNVTFENITATDCFSYFKNREMPSIIWGKPGTPIENIEFKNVKITVKGSHPASEASLNPAENNERLPRHVGAIPSYTWYLRHVRDIRFIDCQFGFEQNDDRPALVIDDGKNVAFEQCNFQKGNNCISRVGYRNTIGTNRDF
ncbi:MAG: glycosyl hydrolase family 28 protein [Planctomycetota bacterium]|jgi:alpha-glucuronidase